MNNNRKSKWWKGTCWGVLAVLLIGVAMDTGLNSLPANAGVLEDYYLQDCADICDSTWAAEGDRGTYGWVLHQDITQELNAETVGVTIDHYDWSNDPEHAMYWYGGDEGGAYTHDDAFAVEFAVNMTEDGFSLRVDQYSFWISSEWIRIGYNDQWTNEDYHRAYWFHDIGLKAAWLIQEPVDLSGIIKVRAYVCTEGNETTYVVEAGDYSAIATTTHERKYFPSCSIIAGYQDLTVYSSKVADVYDEVRKAEKYASYSVLPSETKQALSEVVSTAKNTLITNESITADEVLAVQTAVTEILTDELLIAAKDYAATLVSGSPDYNELNESIKACKTLDELEILYTNATIEGDEKEESSTSSGSGAEDDNSEPKNDNAEIEESSGCFNSIELLGTSVVLMLIAGAYVCKKKNRSV